MRAGTARSSDAGAIHRLIAHYAGTGLLLPRSEAEIRLHIGNFLVLREKGAVLGCAALESYGEELVEIRSLAVDPEFVGRGLGSRLVRFALAEAHRRGFARVFTVTHAPDFFLRQGFAAVRRESLTEKIERDCNFCPKRRSCHLVALAATVIKDRIAPFAPAEEPELVNAL